MVSCFQMPEGVLLLETSEMGQPQLEFSKALPPDGLMFP